MIEKDLDEFGWDCLGAEGSFSVFGYWQRTVKLVSNQSVLFAGRGFRSASIFDARSF